MVLVCASINPRTTYTFVAEIGLFGEKPVYIKPGYQPIINSNTSR